VACSINNENLLYRNSSSVYSPSYLNQLKEILHLSSVVNTDDILAIVNRLIKYLKKNNKGVSASCVRTQIFKGDNLRPSPKNWHSFLLELQDKGIIKLTLAKNKGMRITLINK